MTTTTHPDTDDTMFSDEQVFRAATWAMIREVIRDHGDVGLLTMMEGLSSEHQAMMYEVMDYYEERDQRLGNDPE